MLTPGIIAAWREGPAARSQPLMPRALFIGVVFTVIGSLGIMISPAFLLPMTSMSATAVFVIVGAALRIAHLRRRGNLHYPDAAHTFRPRNDSIQCF